MKTLYKVGTNIGYKPIFVFATGYDNAAKRVLEYLLDQQEKEAEEKSVVADDGSLNLSPFKGREADLPEIQSVEVVTNHIIY